MSYLISGLIFAFCMAMPVGAGTIQMSKNGLNNGAMHTVVTGLGMNIVDTCMFVLYYFGLSFFFTIPVVKVVLWLGGVLVLGYLGFTCIKDAHVLFDTEGNNTKQSYKKSLLDGIAISFVPSNIVFWVATFGTFLTGAIEDSTFMFILACLGILLGFQLHNVLWGLFMHLVNKLSNMKVVYWFNILSGFILFGFSAYFAYQLYLTIMGML